MTLTPKAYPHRRATRLAYDDRFFRAVDYDPDDAPRDNSAELRALRAATLSALDRLTERQRSAVELHHFGGLSQREIAAMWSVTPSAVCHLLDRAYARLRNLIILK